jgi:hypothetical protein
MTPGEPGRSFAASPTERRTTMKALPLAALIAVAVPAGTAIGAPTAQRFTLTARTVDGHARPTRVRAFGPIRGAGKVTIRSSRDNRIDHMTLRLPHGKVFLVAIERAFSVKPDLARCRAVSHGHGTFRVVGGTRAYHDARGHGTYRRRSVIIGARAADGTCLGQSAPPTATTTKVRMTGDVTLRRLNTR